MSDLDVINKLLEAGKITDDDILEAQANIMTEEKERIIENLHVIFCEEDHDKGECLWYEEANMTDVWNRPQHLKYLAYYTELGFRARVKPQDMERFIIGLNYLMASKLDEDSFVSFLMNLALIIGAMFPSTVPEHVPSSPSES
jgi:hypothetical protein